VPQHSTPTPVPSLLRSFSLFLPPSFSLPPLGGSFSLIHVSFVCWQECGVQLTSVTADGDAAIHTLVEQHHGRSVVTNRDPNHYAKGLLKNMENLCAEFPILRPISTTLKQHFLISMVSCG
jgi:hypothetical protein